MKEILEQKPKFGTAPVFLTAISTILGAIMFLRFGWAVGAVGLAGTIAIVIIGHLVTVPTAMALAEIATNQKVEGGGEYFIISRSFGLTIGASIGVALYLSQAISVAFYTIAFTEAFDPIIQWLANDYGIFITKKMIGLASIGLLSWLMLTKGANTGMWMLYIVVAVLGVSLIMFFAGKTTYSGTENYGFFENISFFTVFAIVFPAFTGMTAGVGLSGDLKDPGKSIPFGTLSATLIGMVIYIFIAIKLANNAPQNDLLDTGKQLIMADIAVWGPIIPIGLAAATISSALGSIMVAPRTLNAIANDDILPMPKANTWLAKVKKKNNEPVNASMVTCAIAFFFVLLGDVNAVAEVISMFFMVTYGSICLISLLENFAANPGYRPSFKSKWYLSLIGTVLCIYLMFKINAIYALLAIFLMVVMYLTLSRYKKSSSDMAVIFSGVIFQISRILHVFLQKRLKEENNYWRPSIVALSKNTFQRHNGFDMLRWMSHRIGFGTYIHHVDGYLSKESSETGRDALKRLITMARQSNSSVYVDTLINPNFTTSISQALQLPGISGQDNNTVLFEYGRTKPEELNDVIDNLGLIRSVQFDLCILSSGSRGFGYKNEIHLWITSNDYINASLMIYLAYIILGHPDWHNGHIKLFAIYPVQEMESQQKNLTELIASGRLPISANNISIIPVEDAKNHKQTILEKSRDADLTLVGFRYEALRHFGSSLFEGYDSLGNVLFVNAFKEKEIN